MGASQTKSWPTRAWHTSAWQTCLIGIVKVGADAAEVAVTGFGVRLKSEGAESNFSPEEILQFQSNFLYALSQREIWVVRSGVDVMITIFCDFFQFSAKKWLFS
jgi:hypothetical protein